MLTELLSFLPPFPVWKAGNLGEAGASHVDLENLENLGGKERIVIASVGDQAKEASKLVMEEREKDQYEKPRPCTELLSLIHQASPKI